MVTTSKQLFETKLSALIIQLRTMKEDYKHEINAVKECETDLEVGISCLEDALKSYQKGDDEHSNSSRENSRAYTREMDRG